MNSWKPTGVSFSSGGVHAIGQLGILAALRSDNDNNNDNNDFLSSVRDWYGCSGGCFGAICGLLRASPGWMRDGALLFDMAKATVIQEEVLVEYFSTMGAVTGDPLIDLMGRIANTWEPSFSSWTFADIPPEYGNLHIVAANVSRRCLTVFNAANTPTVRILDAVRASIAIPGFFTPWISPTTGEYYSDGVVTGETYPWSCVSDTVKDTTLVIACCESILREDTHECTPIHSFLDFMNAVLQTGRKTLTEAFPPQKRPRNWIALNNKSVNSLNFRITREERAELFEHGYRVGRAFLNQVAVLGTSGTQPHSERPNTLCDPVGCPGKMSDILQSHIPLPRQAMSRDLQTAVPRLSRRWSL